MSDDALIRQATEKFYLAFVLFREARGESDNAKLAVAYSILNRVGRPGWWGHTIDEVVTKKWQYSSMTDPNDPQLARAWPLSADPAWKSCCRMADAALTGSEANPMPGADSYHDVSITAPNWTEKARFCGQIGRLRFYDVDHDWEAARPDMAGFRS